MISVGLLTDAMTQDRQREVTEIVNRSGAPVRLLANKDLLDVHSRHMALIFCSLLPNERALPEELNRFMRMGVENPPPVIVLSSEPLIEPVISLENDHILVIDPQLSAEELYTLVRRLLSRHPLAFSVVDEDEGEIQSDHGSSDWWISCRRQAGSDEAWPWARVYDDNAVSCGFTEQRVVTLERITDGALPSNGMTYHPDKQQMEFDPLPKGVHCWLLNEKRWPSCQRISTIATECEVNGHGKCSIQTLAGDLVVLSYGKDVFTDDMPKRGRPAMQSVRQRCNERRFTTVVLEIR